MHQRLDSPDAPLRLDDEEEGQHLAHREVARLPGIATQLIGERVRAMYATLVNEPVPDQLLELVRQLEKKEPAE